MEHHRTTRGVTKHKTSRACRRDAAPARKNADRHLPPRRTLVGFMETIGANEQSIQDASGATMWAFSLRLAAKLCDRGFGDQVNSTATYVCRAMKESTKHSKRSKRSNVASAHRRTTSVESDVNLAPLVEACEVEMERCHKRSKSTHLFAST